MTTEGFELIDAPYVRRGIELQLYPEPLPPAEGSREQVYRLFDEFEALLYVGRSVNVSSRLEQHAKTKPWWNLVSDVMLQREFRHGSAQLDEYDAILNEFPMFNLEGVPWRKIRLSERPVEMDRMRNRSLIAGAISRLGLSGVTARLELLRVVEPLVYAQVVDDPRLEDSHWDAGWERERAILAVAEERYFDAFAELHRGPYPLHLRRQRVVVDDRGAVLRVEPARLPPEER